MKSFQVGIDPWKYFALALERVPRRRYELVGIKAIERKIVIFVGGFQQGRILKRIAEAKSTIVKEIVAEENIAHAGLLGNGFQRGVRVDHAHGDQKSVVGNAVQADPAVVARHIFDQPIDGVVGVGAFVHAFRVAQGHGWAAA